LPDEEFRIDRGRRFHRPAPHGAIKATGHRLVAAMDPSDSVASSSTAYFPDCSFFTEFERFDRHIDKLQRSGGDDRIDYVSVCSPNYLHDAHIRFALRSGADVICEKPWSSTLGT
jgi:UDP-N-acetyl-2-amino-2-deoxyglucuronate dehydrogenase